jgi:hypothetical protein
VTKEDFVEQFDNVTNYYSWPTPDQRFFGKGWCAGAERFCQ